MPAPASRSARRRASRGSVIVVVLTTLMFAALALVAFMDRAAVDLLVDHRESVKRRLRVEAFSALELTLGVLAEFKEAGNGLRSPAEGWDDPLGFAGYEPEEGRTVTVTFSDESGKLPLPRTAPQTLLQLLLHWEVPKARAEEVVDALLGWMKPGHVYSTPWQPDYESKPLPYRPPGRPLRSFHELASIEKAREFFYDEAGRPNAYWRRFAENVSLFDFPQPNLNGARPDVLAALGQYGPEEAKGMSDFLRGAGRFERGGPGVFRNPQEIGRVAGPSGNPAGFALNLSALRIHVLVREGRNEYRVAVVVAAPGAAAAVPPGPPPGPVKAENRPGATPPPPPTPPLPAPAAGAGATDERLRYPWVILEVRENEDIPREATA
ncbi:MAG: general secretion pathway protein GspK [Opitutaceae bacterium]